MPPPESFDDMNTKERFEAIDTRLDGIDALLALRVNPTSRFARVRATAWAWFIANRPWVIPTFAVTVAICGWFAPGLFKAWLDHRNDAFNQAVDARINAVLTTSGGVMEKLASIKDDTQKANTTLETLKPFIQTLVQHEMDKAASLPQAKFDRNLPRFADVLAVARSQKAAVSSQAIAQIGKKLSAAQTETSGYWTAASEFITYRSQVAQSVINTRQLPSCILQGITRHTTAPMNSGTNVTVPVGPVEYHYCSIALDAPEGMSLLGRALSWGNVIFDHCVISYNGGSINIVPVQIIENSPPKLIGQQIEFADCYFAVSLKSLPPPTGKMLTENLLAATTNTVTLKVSAS
jgi:hypothetical protein